MKHYEAIFDANTCTKEVFMKDQELFLSDYHQLRANLRDEYPEVWRVVIELCGSVPSETEGTDKPGFWLYARNKPCYSNISVERGEEMDHQLMNMPGIDSYKTLASEEWRIDLKAGEDFRARDSYSLVDNKANEFLDGLNGGLSSYRWKFKAIQNLAIALTTSKLDTYLHDLSDARENYRLSGDYVWRWADSVSATPILGLGWGPTTVLHALTDLGIACKPDIHVMRSAVRYGFFDDIPPTLSDEEIKKLPDRYKKQAVRMMIDLAGLIEPLAHESPRTTLREMDKVLMEGSRLELNNRTES